MKKVDIAIIGAGLSGLLLGQKLKKANKSILVIEKSRGLGGRLATRRIEDKGFDHGAPYLCENENVTNILNELELAPVRTSQGLFVEGGMTKIAKLMAKDLPILLGHKVEKIEEKMILTTDQGEIISAERIVITAPLPQALLLLKNNQIAVDQLKELEEIEYTKALMALVISDKFEIKNSTEIHSIIDMKSRLLHPEGFIARATPEFSDIHFEETDEKLLTWFNDKVKNSSHMEVKRWRYATPLSALPYDFIEVKKNLFLIGDSFRYPDVRGSILSALKLAQKLA